ncbi:PTS system, galactitol-specific IIC component [Eubacterium aggregans]|uniref:PTS system, galactitol-specific IIC component n=2 Tax=Eubacterium aggregans TaxID=81409 RepID=A0A1H4AZD1_9FIRM|nr:PTS system, galactitol-specific IIC component [Eubacterium aggregans]
MQAAFDMPQGVKLISSLCDGANPLTWSIVRMMEFVGSIFGAIILGVLALGLALWNRSRILKNAKLRKEMESEDVSAV